MRRRAPAAGRSADAGRWQRQLHAGRRWALWGAVLGVLAGSVLAAPARWLAQGLADASAGRLLLAEARGTVWDGDAVLVLTGGPGSRDAAALPGRLHWSVRPGWGHLQLQATQACCLSAPLTVQLSPRWQGFTVSVAGGGAGSPPAGTAGAAPGAPGAPEMATPIGHWPASWLAGLGAPFNTLALGGTLRLSGPGLTVHSVQGRIQLAGALQAELLDASSRISPLPVLGSYRLHLQGPPQPGDTALLQLSTLGGALLLDGNGQWAGGKLRFRGQAQAAPGQDAALGNLLNIIGRRQGALSVLSIG